MHNVLDAEVVKENVRDFKDIVIAIIVLVQNLILRWHVGERSLIARLNVLKQVSKGRGHVQYDALLSIKSTFAKASGKVKRSIEV